MIFRPLPQGERTTRLNPPPHREKLGAALAQQLLAGDAFHLLQALFDLFGDRIDGLDRGAMGAAHRLRHDAVDDLELQQILGGDLERRGGFLRVRLACDREIPFGYYDAGIETDTGAVYKSFLIVAPSKSAPRNRDWGAFAPAYALRMDDTSIGDYGALRKAAALIGRNDEERALAQVRMSGSMFSVWLPQ